MVWALVGGLVLDLASGSPFGITPLPLLFASVVAGLAYNRFKGRLLFTALISFLSIIVFQAIYLLMLLVMGHVIIWAETFQQVFIPLLFVHIILLPIIYLGISSLALLLVRQEPRIGQWKSSSNGNV